MISGISLDFEKRFRVGKQTSKHVLIRYNNHIMNTKKKSKLLNKPSTSILYHIYFLICRLYQKKNSRLFFIFYTITVLGFAFDLYSVTKLCIHSVFTNSNYIIQSNAFYYIYENC